MSRGQTNFWNNGQVKWVDKTNNTPAQAAVVPSYNDILTQNLIGCDVKTDIVNVSMKIEKNGTILKLFNIADIVSWQIDNNIIKLFMKSSAPYSLLFISVAQAVKADLRMYLITNGNDIQGCDDDQAYVCGSIGNLNAIFE